MNYKIHIIKKLIALLALLDHLLVQHLMKLREMEGTSEGQSAVVGTVAVPAMTQHELITWYFDYQTARCVPNLPGCIASVFEFYVNHNCDELEPISL